MSRVAVNLSTVFTEVPFLERFKKAKECGFSIVECQFPYEVPIEAIQCELTKYHLSLLLINLPPGDWSKGERGLATNKEKSDVFKESVAKGIEYARKLKVPYIHCMAGITGDRDKAREIYLENIKYAASEMSTQNITLLIEPINHFDMPGYFLNDIDLAAQIVRETGKSNVKIQFDFYHIQRIQGNLLDTFQRYFNMIGHVQIADVPGRHQPNTGEINYKHVLQTVIKQGYQGYIGLEYSPKGNSEESFKWIKMDDLEGVLK